MYRKNKDQQSLKHKNSKMKTLPNEGTTLETHHFFQSVSDHHQSHVPSIDLASPTFATECQATSITNFLQ